MDQDSARTMVEKIIKRERRSELRAISVGKRLLATMLKSDRRRGGKPHYVSLAIACQGLDKKYGIGGDKIVLDWLLDVYVALEFERAYPLLLKTWKYLIAHKHHEQNGFEYFDCEEAFFLNKDQMVMVMGGGRQDDTRILIVDERSPNQTLLPLFNRCYVRRIWKRRKRNCIGSIEKPTLADYRALNFKMEYHAGPPFRLYGDCRDKGHVLTYSKVLSPFGSCDKVRWNIQEPMWWLFHVNHLWKQIQLAQQDHSLLGCTDG